MKYTKYILILILLTTLLSPLIQVEATGSWYLEYKPNSGSNNVTLGPYSTMADCQSTSTYGLGVITKPCFQSVTPLTNTPAPVVNWYLEYKPNSGSNNVILGPYSQTGCQSKSVQGLGVITKPCFQSDTTPTPAPAPASTPSSNTNYQLLAPLPCPPGTTGCNGNTITNVDTTGGLGKYLNPMIKIFIGICAVLSVVMIVVGGLEYMTSELIASKEEGKKRIEEALLGLIIALGAWALLYTINPDLLNSDVNMPATTPLGDCTYSGANQFASGVTKANCDGLGGTWAVDTFQGNGAGGTW